MKINMEFVPLVNSNKIEKIKNNKNHINNSIKKYMTCQYFFYGHSIKKLNKIKPNTFSYVFLFIFLPNRIVAPSSYFLINLVIILVNSVISNRRHQSKSINGIDILF
jgi:hypothetical protein